MVANPARGQVNREMLISSSCSRLRIWSREMGSAGPSRVSRLILHTTKDSRFPLWRLATTYHTVDRHRVSAELIMSRIFAPMALTDESLPAQGYISP